jgi:hypothetical protein
MTAVGSDQSCLAGTRRCARPKGPRSDALLPRNLVEVRKLHELLVLTTLIVNFLWLLLVTFQSHDVAHAKKSRISNELRLEICESLRSTMRGLTYPAAGLTMQFGARHLHGIGNRPPSKKTTAIPGSERRFD